VLLLLALAAGAAAYWSFGEARRLKGELGQARAEAEALEARVRRAEQQAAEAGAQVKMLQGRLDRAEARQKGPPDPGRPPATSPADVGAKPEPPPAESPAAKAEPASPGPKVLQFCLDHMGKKVADGECAELVVRAVQATKAKRFPPYGPGRDYVWGTLVATFTADSHPVEKLLPGDVLQFRDAKMTSVQSLPGGATLTRTEVSTHHTAVVLKVTGGTVSVVHQNAGPAGASDEQKRVVQTGEFALAGLTGGWVKAYRPVPLPPADVTALKYTDAVALDLLRLVNAERARRGVKALALSPEAGAAARALSRRVAGGAVPSAAEVSEALTRVGYPAGASRLLYGQGPPVADSILRGLLQNPGTREQLLDPAYADVGIFIRRGGPNGATLCLVLAARA
jgi:hypothetical protein